MDAIEMKDVNGGGVGDALFGWVLAFSYVYIFLIREHLL